MFLSIVKQNISIKQIATRKWLLYSLMINALLVTSEIVHENEREWIEWCLLKFLFLITEFVCKTYHFNKHCLSIFQSSWFSAKLFKLQKLYDTMLCKSWLFAACPCWCGTKMWNYCERNLFISAISSNLVKYFSKNRSHSSICDQYKTMT